MCFPCFVVVLLLQIMSTRQLEVLRLYRDLIRYSQRLKYTDVNFYLNRIKQEFAKGKTLEDESEIIRQIAVDKLLRISLQSFALCFRKVENS